LGTRGGSPEWRDAGLVSGHCRRVLAAGAKLAQARTQGDAGLATSGADSAGRLARVQRVEHPCLHRDLKAHLLPARAVPRVEQPEPSRRGRTGGCSPAAKAKKGGTLRGLGEAGLGSHQSAGRAPGCGGLQGSSGHRLHVGRRGGHSGALGMAQVLRARRAELSTTGDERAGDDRRDERQRRTTGPPRSAGLRPPSARIMETHSAEGVFQMLEDHRAVAGR